MPYPSVFRTRRIVFLLALLCPSATLAYIALPHDDILLRRAPLTARTQDITIDSRRPRTLPHSPFLAPPPALLDRSSGVRTHADDAAITELALATAAATPTTSVAIVPEASTSTNDGGFGKSAVAPRRGASGAAFASQGMATVGPWGGTVGIALGQHQSGDVATTVKVAKVKTGNAPTEPQAAESNSGSTNTGSAAGAANTAQGSTVAAAPGSAAAIQLVSNLHSAVTGTASGGRSTTAGARGTLPGVSASVPVVTLHPTAADLTGSPAPTPEPLSMLLIAGGLGAAYAGRRYIH